MDTLVEGARAELVASGRDGDAVDKLFYDLSKGYKTLQSIVGHDFIASLDAIGPTISQLLSIAEKKQDREDHAWEALQRAEEELNKAGRTGKVVFLGHPKDVPSSELLEIGRTYFRHRRGFFYEMDWENEIYPDPTQDDQKNHKHYVDALASSF
jgi:hypothetical protein